MMTRLHRILAALYFLLSLPCSVQSQTVEVSTGIEITDVYGLNYTDNKVAVSFYLWFNYDLPVNSHLDMAADLFISNGLNVKKETVLERKQGRHVYQLVRGTAELRKVWTVADYPFDDHTVRIFVAAPTKEGSAVKLKPDTANSVLDSQIKMNGWHIDPLTIQYRVGNEESQAIDDTKIHPSNLGAPNQPQSSRHKTERVVFAFHLQRSHPWLVFLKTFSPLIASTFLALLALGIRPDKLDARCNTAVGSLFAAIGSQLVVSASLPPNSITTFADLTYLMSYIVIILSTYFLLKRDSPQTDRTGSFRPVEPQTPNEDKRMAKWLGFAYGVVLTLLCIGFASAHFTTDSWW